MIRHKDWIVTYHEHDSLLQNIVDEDLTEEERKLAWEEYKNEREGRFKTTFGEGPCCARSLAQEEGALLLTQNGLCQVSFTWPQ